MDDTQRTLLETAQSLASQGDRKGAIDLFGRLADAAAPDPELLMPAAFGAFRLGDPALAERLLRRIIELRPGMAPAHLNLGNVLQAQGRLADAALSIRHALEITPRDVMAHNNLGGVFEQMGCPDKAETAYRNALDLTPDNPALHEALGRTLEHQARPDAALAAYSAALKVDRSYAPAHAAMGNLLYNKMRRLDDAEAAYREALEIDPGHCPARQNLAVLLHETGKLDEAEEHLRQVARAMPDNLLPHFNLAKVLFDRRDPAGAVAACDAALERAPGNGMTLAFKAICLAEAGDREGARFLTDMDRLVTRRALPVPIAYPTRQAFNAALFDQVSAMPDRFSEPRTDGGRQTRDLMIDPTGPLAFFRSMIDKAVAGYVETAATVEHPFTAVRPQKWRLVSWGTIVRQIKDGEDTHNHQTAWLSGVYYVRVPDAIDTTGSDTRGWIEFGRPPHEIRHNFEPAITVFPPTEGVLILFPGYFYHRVLPFSASSPRMSIAFDVMPIGTPSAPGHARQGG